MARRRGSLTPQTLGEFSLKTATFAKVGLPAANRKGVEGAALLAKNSANSSIRLASGGDMVLSQVGRSEAYRNAGSRAKVGARYNIKGKQNPTALVFAYGPLHLLDNPTKPHQITAKVKKGRSRASKSAFYNAIFGGDGGFANATPMRTPYGPRYRVQHPGTRGKQSFFRGINKAKPFIPKQFSSDFRSELRRYFG